MMADAPKPNYDVSQMSDADFEKAMLTGEAPSAAAPAASETEQESKVDTTAEAAAAEPVEQAEPKTLGSKTKTADPESQKPEEVIKHKKTAKERISDLNAEAAAEEQELAKALERRSRAQEARRTIEREDAADRKRAEHDGKQPPAKDAPSEPAFKKY